MGGAAALGIGASTALAEVAHVGGVTADALGTSEGTPIAEELPFPGDAPAPRRLRYTSVIYLWLVAAGRACMPPLPPRELGRMSWRQTRGVPDAQASLRSPKDARAYDSDYDNLEGTLKALSVTSDYLANVDAFRHTLEISKQAYEENYEFGFTGGYQYAPAAGYSQSYRPG